MLIILFNVRSAGAGKGTAIGTATRVGRPKLRPQGTRTTVVRLAIEPEQIESADFAFEESILIREASTEEVTYLLEHPSKDETNENQQVATRRRTKLFSCESR